MRLYRVMERATESERGGAVETRFVAERFRWLAFLVPVIWLLFQRLWLTALLVLLLNVALGFVLPRFGFGQAYVILCSLAIGLLIALESASLAVSGLEKGGWTEAGTATGETQEEAELRWFSRRGAAETNPAEQPGLVGAPV